MGDTNKQIPDDQKAAENKTNASGELKDAQLENVNGGWGVLIGGVSESLKSLGEAMTTMARKG